MTTSHTHTDKSVFISYRHTNAGWALAIYKYLTENGYDVFLDYTSINTGDFEQVILENIRTRTHFILLLTPSALERCREPGDWIRREIEYALDCHRNIIPLIFDGFDYDSLKTYLPSHLSDLLRRYQAMSVPTEYFDDAMRRLCHTRLNIPLHTVKHPTRISTAAGQYAARQKRHANAEPAVTPNMLSAEKYFELGNQNYRSGNYFEAIRAYDKAIVYRPEFANAYNNRGEAHRAFGRYEAAVEDLSRAIQLRPDFANAYNNRGMARIGQGDLAAALNDFDLAVRLKTDYAIAYYNRGCTYSRLGNRQLALLDYNEAIKHNPGYVNALQQRALIYTEINDLDAAIRDYTALIQQDVDNPQLFHSRGRLRFHNGEYTPAILDFSVAIQLDPGNAAAYNDRGVIYTRQGEYDHALTDYRAALSINPDDRQASKNLRIAQNLQQRQQFNLIDEEDTQPARPPFYTRMPPVPPIPHPGRK